MTRMYFHDNLDKLGQEMQRLNAPVDIWYGRYDSWIEVELVTIGKTDMEEIAPGLDLIIDDFRDYIFTPPQLLLDTWGVPKVGDTITELDETGTNGPTYVVRSISGEKHCFKWTTATQKRIRVHTIFDRPLLFPPP